MAQKKRSQSLHAALARVIARAWSDDGFRRRLKRSPRAALKEEGISVAAGVRVKIVEDTSALLHLVIPVKPRGLPETRLASLRTIVKRTITSRTQLRTIILRTIGGRTFPLRTILRTFPIPIVRTVPPGRTQPGPRRKRRSK